MLVAGVLKVGRMWRGLRWNSKHEAWNTAILFLQKTWGPGKRCTKGRSSHRVTVRWVTKRHVIAQWNHNETICDIIINQMMKDWSPSSNEQTCAGGWSSPIRRWGKNVELLFCVALFCVTFLTSSRWGRMRSTYMRIQHTHLICNVKWSKVTVILLVSRKEIKANASQTKTRDAFAFAYRTRCFFYLPLLGRPFVGQTPAARTNHLADIGRKS